MRATAVEEGRHNERTRGEREKATIGRLSSASEVARSEMSARGLATCVFVDRRGVQNEKPGRERLNRSTRAQLLSRRPSFRHLASSTPSSARERAARLCIPDFEAPIAPRAIPTILSRPRPDRPSWIDANRASDMYISPFRDVARVFWPTRQAVPAVKSV
jgi:hypothetical protein